MESVQNLHQEKIWLTKCIYDEAEKQYYENVSKASITPLAGEVAKARQLLIQSRDSFKDLQNPDTSIDPDAVKFLEKKTLEFQKLLKTVVDRLDQLETRIGKLEGGTGKPVQEVRATSTKPSKDDDDDVDLFGSDSDGETEAAAKVREERLAAYNAKKSKKPVLIAKSSIILDVKPWDDETDMKVMENEVRKISTDGLLWGASKLVPLAFGIHKLQITCVVEDEKVSIDWLQEEITNIEEYVQSVDIAAFNKI